MSDKVTMIITIVISFIAISINFNTFSRLESPPASWPRPACVQPDPGPDFHVHAIVPVHYEEF
jgi:hypothetical protein